MNNQQVQRRGGSLSLAATLRQKEKTPAVAMLNRQLTGGSVILDTSRIAASVCHCKQAYRMDFLMAVLLAVLIHILAPLVVRYVDVNFSINRTYEVQHGRGEASDRTELYW
ncbi:hypothetical protein V5K00_RS21890 [Enterobacter asburiae]